MAKNSDYPGLMAAYNHPRDQQPLPPVQLGDFNVGFLTYNKRGRPDSIRAWWRGPETIPWSY